MNDFPQPSIDSIGGIASFKFIEVENVISIPRIINHQINANITIVPYTNWNKGYASFDSLSYSEPGKQSENGTYYEVKLSGFVPDSAEILKLLVKMDGRRFVLHLTDNDALQRVAGTIDQPLTFSCDFTTETVRSVKGYTFKFSGLLSNRAPIFVGPPQSSSTSTSGSVSA